MYDPAHDLELLEARVPILLPTNRSDGAECDRLFQARRLAVAREVLTHTAQLSPESAAVLLAAFADAWGME